MEQRTQEWFDARKMKFTASRINELLGVKGLGLTGESYARDVAQEYFFDKEEMFVSNDMQRGIDLEPMAFDFIKQKFEKDFISVENCGFFAVGEMGASPDGLIGDDAILEIKCPKQAKFLEVVETNKVDKKYYDQMQCQMYCTNRKKAYYLNYCIIDGIEYGHLIEVERDEERIKLMIERVGQAVIIRDQIIENIKANKQW